LADLSGKKMELFTSDANAMNGDTSSTRNDHDDSVKILPEAARQIDDGNEPASATSRMSELESPTPHDNGRSQYDLCKTDDKKLVLRGENGTSQHETSTRDELSEVVPESINAKPIPSKTPAWTEQE
jgi:hypothetical protein